jgi:hypothetical protein
MLPERIVPYEAAPAPALMAPVPVLDPGLAASWSASPSNAIGCDPCAPTWCDPVSRVPNMFGGFFGNGLQGTRTKNDPAVPLHFTGVGGEGSIFTGTITAPIAVTGPKGPYTLSNNITIPTFTSPYTLPQNGELTGLVDAKFPGAKFTTGGGTANFSGSTFFYDYLVPGSHNVESIALPNPAGGGLVGRNLYFENGSALPQDRVYFFYNYVGNFQLGGSTLDINRYVFGVEKTFFNGLMSVELRVPFAGTANNDQTAGQSMSVDHAEFGNIGLAIKGVVYRTPNFVASVGVGFSLPTASSSQMLVAGTPIIEIENRTCLIQPLLGLAWAPNDRFYAQAGLQFDLDPTGNPVQGLNASGGLTDIGRMHDQAFAFANWSAGYWIYRNPTGRLTGVALQTELDYYGSFGSPDVVQSGALTVTDPNSSVNVLNITPGAIFEFGNHTRFSLGVSVPLTNDRLYNWNVMAQLNYNF